MVLLPNAICKDLTQREFFRKSFHKSHGLTNLNIKRIVRRSFSSNKFKHVHLHQTTEAKFNSCKTSVLDTSYYLPCGGKNRPSKRRWREMREERKHSSVIVTGDSTFHVIAVELAKSRIQIIPLHFVLNFYNIFNHLKHRLWFSVRSEDFPRP